ncbi:MAG TPA: precorrin-8X methylmutase [Acidimicrobiales bacterium]|jgi:precorrin-8X/cobalt-precorrin-8 methylmutase|nr:precorrin-8X methylmutase [Acidimicrobiales bacterium]
MTEVHPIEAESYRRLGDRVDLSAWPPGPRAVVARVIHASADLEFATTMVVDEAAVDAGVEALRAGAPVIADVEMVLAGMPSLGACCHLREATGDGGLTRSAAGLRLAAGRHPAGAVVVVGCAPTALVEAVRLVESGSFLPALLVGLPVGFVGAAEAKELARACAVPSMTNVGDKGGSAVAAAAVNALARLAAADPAAPPTGRR